MVRQCEDRASTGRPDPNRTNLKVTLDTTLWPSFLVLSYLVDYPYGCVEQTTSRMLLPPSWSPHLYQTLGLTDANLEKKIPKVIEKSIRRLLAFQHS